MNLIEENDNKSTLGVFTETKDVYGIIYSRFGELGPKPQFWFPESFTYDAALEILMRSTCFISVDLSKMHDKLSMFPFPEYNLLGITYYYEEPTDPSEEFTTASITILIHEDSQSFFNRNMGNIKTNLQSLTNQLISNKNQHQSILSKYYLNLIELLNSYKSLELVVEDTEEPGLDEKNGVLLSYFHTKIGPIPFYIYPENTIDEEQQIKISKELNLEIAKGFFTRSYYDFIALHHYFELPSKLARGKTEMCLITFLLRKMPSQEKISQISFQFTEFLNKLKNEPNTAWGFYVEGYYFEDKMDLIFEMNEFIQQWVRDVYDVIVKGKTIQTR